MSKPLVCLTTHSFIVEIGCYSLIMISFFCSHLQSPFFGGLVMTLFYFSISTSVISLIKNVNVSQQVRSSKNGSIKKESEPSEEEVREKMNKILSQEAAHANWDRELKELNTELSKVESAMVILKTTLITRFSISHVQVVGRTISPAFIVRKCECGRCSLRYFPHQYTGVWCRCRCRFIGDGRWAAGGERHNQWEGDYHIPILHQSSNISFRTPQGILQRPQNHQMSLNNLTQDI